MMDVIKNGLKQNLTFRGALHLSLKDKVVSGYDKLVININKSKEHGTWADFIVIPSFGGDHVETFRIGGRVLGSLTGHRDLHKWVQYCVNELDWNGVISKSNIDTLILDIFNFVNNVSEDLITKDTEFNIKDEDGLGVETFYPYYSDDDPEEDEDDDDEDIVEEVVEEVVKEAGEEEEDNEYTGVHKPMHPGEPIQFLDYKLKAIEDGGLGCKSPNFIFSYENDNVYSKLDLFIEKNDQGNPYVTKADLYQKGFGGSRSKTKSISTPEDLEDFSNRKEEFESRIMNAAGFGSVTSEAFYADRLNNDMSTLIRKLLEGMEWKESLDIPDTNNADEDDDY